jgi:hypothetical protein
VDEQFRRVIFEISLKLVDEFNLIVVWYVGGVNGGN